MSDPFAIDRVKVRLSTKIWQLEAEVKRLNMRVGELDAALYDATDGISGTLLRDEIEGLRRQNAELVTEIKIRDGVISDLQNQQAAPHTLHVIGWIGSKRAYLDISADEARQRYAASHADDVERYGFPEVLTFSFEDEFPTYDAEPPEAKSELD